MAVPYTFGTATASIPLSNLDSNFATTITLGNTAIQLGNTVTTLNNMTLANVTVSSGNVTFTNVSATLANVTTANITTEFVGTSTITTAGITTANVTTANVTTGIITTAAITTANVTTANVSTALSYSGTLTGGTGIVNLGSGQFYKDASGNVGIGTTSPGYKLNTYASTTSLSIQQVIQNSNAGAGTAALGFSVSSASGGEGLVVKGGIGFQRNAAYGGGFMAFYNNNSGAVGDFTTADEAMRIDNAKNFLVATTNTAPGNGSGSNVAGFAVNTNGTTWVSRSGFAALSVNRVDTTGDVLRAASAGTQVGGISVTSSATAFNTSSDYRLKQDIAPMTGALAKVAALKPVTYKWKCDKSDGEGFIAHELAEVCPQAVTGAKDAVDADGNPEHQGIDTSFLVATLTAAIQELKAEFDAYKSTHP